MSEIPRRCYVEKMVPAELKIREAVSAVEEMGADVRLTDAVVLLGQAKDRVADFVDGIDGHASRDPEVAELRAEINLANANFEVMKGLYDAEREASRKLVEAAKVASTYWFGRCAGTSHVLPVDEPEEAAFTALREALKFYATPGHSPEGK